MQTPEGFHILEPIDEEAMRERYLRPAVMAIRQMIRDGVPQAEVERRTGLKFINGMFELIQSQG